MQQNNHIANKIHKKIIGQAEKTTAIAFVSSPCVSLCCHHLVKCLGCFLSSVASQSCGYSCQEARRLQESFPPETFQCGVCMLL